MSCKVIMLNSVPREKIYPSSQALGQVERMNKIALNRKEIEKTFDDKIISINIRS